MRVCVSFVMILVLIAHNGVTYELEATSGTKIGKVQAALENLTGVPPEQQILTLEGIKLDGEKTFSDYELSEERFHEAEGEGEGEDVGGQEGVKVFFYNKKLLQANSIPPKPEMLPTLKIEYPQYKDYQPHAYPELQQSGVPVVRHLPKFERQFCFHLDKCKSHIDASAEYLRICERLLAEQEVQALAIDSAQENVDKHYGYISNMYDQFQKHFSTRVEDQERILGSFAEDLKALEAAETHKIVQEKTALSGTKIKTIGELIPIENLVKWHTQCSAMHAQFKPKAGELSSLFDSVKHDVEALFMTVPSVDITKLSERLETNQQLLVEMSSVREVLEKDWLLSKEQLALGLDKISSSSSEDRHKDQLGTRFLEECAALQSMNEIHINDHITRIEECSKILERFTKHCVDCKNAMSRCVHSQMKSIAILQNRISITRNKLSAYKEVSRKIEGACAHLELVHRIPAAYYNCLGEVIRRRSFADIFSLHAQRFAESMSSLRQKEEASRHNFEQNYVGLLPQELIFALNLQLAPPICEVHVSPDEYSMLDIELEDIRDAKASAAANRASSKLKKDFPRILDAHQGSEDSAINLQIENASLRAQLASYVAKWGSSLLSEAGEAGLEEKTEGAASDAKEKLIATLANNMASKDKQISEYESKIIELEKTLNVLEIEKSSAPTSLHVSEPPKPTPEPTPAPAPANLLSRCSASDFKVQDIALFIENDKGQYEAMNFHFPHYYLSPESLDLFKTQNSRKKHVFGQIVHMEEKVAEKDAQYIYSKDLNLGDRYHLLTICLLE